MRAIFIEYKIKSSLRGKRNSERDTVKLLIDQTFENIWDVTWPKQSKQTHYVATGGTRT